jgi:hypothetical protein
MIGNKLTKRKGVTNMNMNPMILMQLQQRLQTFQQEHPKFLPFMTAVKDNALEEGTVFAMKVTTPEGKTLESNIKLTANDVETIRMMMDPSNQN